MDDLRDALLLHVDSELGVRGDLVSSILAVVDAREALDLSGARLGVGASSVRLLAELERGRDVDEEEGSTGGSSGTLDDLTSGLAGARVGGGRGGNDGSTSARELGLEGTMKSSSARPQSTSRCIGSHGDEADALDVLVTVLGREAELWERQRASLINSELDSEKREWRADQKRARNGRSLREGARRSGHPAGSGPIGAPVRWCPCPSCGDR